MRTIHHTTPTDMVCTICKEPILTVWYDAEEKNGKSETYQERKDGVVHYWCTDNPKTLQQLNEERRRSG
jgi:hypothetical protein